MIIQPPFFIYPDITGKAGELLKIYVGTANVNPVTNPISVYSDTALSVPVAQPIRTSNGFAVSNGSPVNMYIAQESYSIAIYDRENALVYSNTNVGNRGTSTYYTVALAKADLSLITGDMVQTLGYHTAGDGGDGLYKVVNASPGSLATVNHLMSNGLWLSLQHNGKIDLKQAGAKFDGDTDMSGIDASPTYVGTDDTASIQAVLDLVKSKAIKYVTAPVGITNFTTLTFYDAASLENNRGGWSFMGSGRVQPKLFASLATKSGVYMGTVFKCVSITGSFDVNTATESATTLDDTSQMNQITMGDFSVLGKPSSGVNLVKFDLVTNHSDVGHISIYSYAAGRGLYMRSCYTSNFHHIQMYGSLPANIVSGGYGLYYDTDKGRGGMVDINNCTFDGFDTVAYVGHTTLSASYTYTGYPSFSFCQFRAGNTNLGIGKITASIPTTGALGLTLNDCYLETPTLDTGVNISLKRCASLRINGGSLFGNGTTKHISVTDEYTDTASTAPAESTESGTVVLDGTYVQLQAGSYGVYLPDSSWYQVYMRNLKGILTTLTSGAALVFVTDTTAFYGTVRVNDPSIVGTIQTNSPYVINKLQYLHPHSSCIGLPSYALATTETFNATNRPYLPAVINAAGGTTTTITLPAAANFITNTGVILLTNVETIVRKRNIGLLVINCSSADSAQRIEYNAAQGTSLAVDTSFVGEFRINTVFRGSEIVYVITQDIIYATDADVTGYVISATSFSALT